MLAKQERLTTAEFDQVIQQGKTVRIDVLYLKYLPIAEGGSKFAVAVPKKIVKTSVLRHFFKRGVFANIQQYKDVFPQGYFVLFVTKEYVVLTKEAKLEAIKQLGQKVASCL